MWDILGTVASAALGYMGQEEANDTNREIAREQMEFQERMSNTSYQRAVGDMKAAGLNPALAYEKGGASSPAGAMTRVENSMGAAMSSANQAMNVIGAAQQMKMTEAQTAQTEAQTKRIIAETQTAEAYRARYDWETALLINQDLLSPAAVEKGQYERDMAQILKNHAARQYKADVAADTFSADSARRKAESLAAQHRVPSAAAAARLLQLQIPQAENEAKFAEKYGEMNPYIRQLLSIIRLITAGKVANSL